MNIQQIDKLILEKVQLFSDTLYHNLNIRVPIILQVILGMYLVLEFGRLYIIGDVPFISIIQLIFLLITVVASVFGIHLYKKHNSGQNTRNALELIIWKERIFINVLFLTVLLLSFAYMNWALVLDNIGNSCVLLFWYLVSTTEPSDPPKYTIKKGIYV